MRLVHAGGWLAAWKVTVHRETVPVGPPALTMKPPQVTIPGTAVLQRKPAAGWQLPALATTGS
jgi:hypothetical protein